MCIRDSNVAGQAMSHEADLFARNPSTLAVSFCARVFVVIALGVGVGPRGQVAELWALSILLVNLYSPFLPKAARSLSLIHI